MFGKMENQVNRLFKMSEIKAEKGSSKDIDRRNFKEEYRQKNGKNPTSHEINKNGLGFYSQKTIENHVSTWKQFATFIRGNGVKDLEKASNRQIEKFLYSKIEQGITHKSYQDICSHITKFEQALNRYAENESTGKSYNFDKAIDYLKDRASEQLEKTIEARFYQKPHQIIDNISNEKFNISASIMYESGARINEASLISESRLGGIIEHQTRGEVGKIILESADSKGGKQRDLYVSKETYSRIQTYIKEHGELKIDRSTRERQDLRNAIKEAAKISDQKYTGAHGLRHNFAQERVNELQNDYGKSYLEAITITSKEMGHERPSITEHYLRK